MDARSQAFTLWPDDQVLDWSAESGVGNSVRGAGVELGDFPGGEDEIVVAERQPQPSGQHAQPFVAFVRRLAGPWWLVVRCGQDVLVDVQAPDVPGQRQYRLVVSRTLRREVARFLRRGGRGADEGAGCADEGEDGTARQLRTSAT